MRVVITGASAGIGTETARALAKKGAHLILATRSKEKTQFLIDETRADWVKLDLADLDSVKSATEKIDGEIDILIANAGVAGTRGTTKQGFEMAFGTNHLGHFVFVQRLLPRMKKNGRIVIVASAAHYRAKNIDWNALKQRTKAVGWREYQVSKLCNVLYTRELAKRAPDVHVYAVHPGVIASDLWRSVPWPLRSIMKMTMRTNEEGAFSTIHCATSPDVANESGLYYTANGQKREPSALAKDDSVAKELWQKSEEWAKAWL